ncbi:hypothetical protein NVP1149O_27 [Vibrio phage 1.149.O._10N.286.55.A12]|nr:hypothetical protein NVP1149O_27 [Vibrio phage 1.149.O._10N.286.55.A12]
MKLVIIESPFAASETHTVEQHIEYARQCMRDSLMRGESPYASHLLYTQDGVLDDLSPSERKMGIEAGFKWRDVSELTVFYVDYGYSSGMQLGLQDCINKRKPYEIRKILGE